MKRRNILGLSLVEMLISLALMALMAIILANALDFGRQAWERSSHLAPIQEQALARKDLRTWLENYDRKYPFKGTQTGFTFTHWPNPRPNHLTFEYHAAVAVERDGPASLLHLNITNTDDPAQDTYMRSQLVATGLQNVTLRYYGQSDATQPMAWHSTWDYPTGHLELIKIEAMRLNGKPWPPLTVRVGVITDASVVDISTPRPKD